MTCLKRGRGGVGRWRVNGMEEDLLLRAEPLPWAEEISQRMVEAVR
jgi:hypothetical protein